MLNISNINLAGLYDLGQQLVDMYKAELKAQNVNASGALSRSLDYDLDIDDKELTLYLIYNSYAYFVENGRQPSRGEYGSWKTKYKDIEKWIRDKGLPVKQKEIPRVAGAIVHKITKYGYYNYNQEGKHILQKVLETADSQGLIDKVCNLIFDAYDEDVSVDIQKLW